MGVDERALKLSCALAFMRWRDNAGRTDLFEAAEDLGVDGDGPLALSMWLLFGRTCAGDGDLDEATVRATILFSERIMSEAAATSSRDAL